jgi:enoyl-CoA hydratase/carnithine racemase
MSIETTTRNGVTTIEIARPEKKNALTLAMYEAMTGALRAATADRGVRSVLIAGQPGVFTAGSDLEDFAKRPLQSADSPILRFMRTLIEVDKPVVAAVTGMAIGIGATLLLHCDLVYVADDAKLIMPFVGLGLVPEFASSLLLPRLLGPRRAAEALLLGDPIDAKTAVTLGLANAALPAAEVLPHARRIAERFNTLPPAAVRDSKRLMRSAERETVARQIEAEAEIFSTRLRGPEAKEALQAFFEKRRPDFSKF